MVLYLRDSTKSPKEAAYPISKNNGGMNYDAQYLW